MNSETKFVSTVNTILQYEGHSLQYTVHNILQHEVMTWIKL